MMEWSSGCPPFFPFGSKNTLFAIKNFFFLSILSHIQIQMHAQWGIDIFTSPLLHNSRFKKKKKNGIDITREY